MHSSVKSRGARDDVDAHPSVATMSSGRERLAEYRRRVQARYAPVVTAVTTPEVDASCAASGLTFADLLRPFCELRGLDVPMRHNPEAPPYVLTEFAIRVHSLAECRQPAADTADDHMTRSVAPWAASDEASLARTLAEIPTDVPSLVALARDGRAPGDAVGDAAPGPRDEPAWFCTPWLNRYAARLDRTLMFAEHESVDHPSGMLVAVSSDHPDPVAEFRRLAAPYYQNPDSYPPLMRSEAANPDVPKHFVLVHDGRSTTTTAEAAAAKLDDAKTHLGADAVSLLPVNSGPGAHPVPDVWSAHAEIRVVTGDGTDPERSAEASEVSPDASKGVFMSDGDVVAHRRFVERYAVASLVPAMETRLRALNANISATRKGLKNQFKSFWGRSTGQVAKPEGDGGYTFRSAESEIRVAADLAFALRDHDTAAQHYRLLQSDYKADKAWRRLGAVQEALGHALALSKPEAAWFAEGAPFRECRRDAERELEQAAACFARAHVNVGGADAGGAVPAGGAVQAGGAAGTPVAAGTGASTSTAGGPGSVAERTRLATRASLAHAAFLSACGAHREAAAPLMRVSAEEAQTHLRGGLLLEAAAMEYCRASPPMARKCAIHLVLAGHRYNQGGARAHAIRCYAAALPVYQHDGAPLATLGSAAAAAKPRSDASSAEPAEGWSRATEHLHFALGRQVAHAGSILAAGEYFRRLLECARRQPAATQATYLREYLYVARCAADAAAAAPAAAADETEKGTETETGSAGSEPATDAGLAAGRTAELVADERLPLPIVDAGDVRVHFQDGHSDAVSAPVGGETPACASWPASRWASMEEDGLVPAGLQGGGATWLDKPREKGAEQRGVCAAGEEVGVDVRFRNPLKVPIDVTDVRLACEFADAGTNAGTGTGTGTGTNEAPSARAAETWVSTPAAAAALEPGETKTIRLGCTPARAGTLRIVGVTWTLCDAKRGFRRFDVRAPRTRRARGADGASEWTRDVPREKRLAFTVVPAMPRLEVSLEGLPATLPAGAAALATLRVRNVASVGPDGGSGPAAHRVRVRLPAGGVAVPADVADAGELSRFGGDERASSSDEPFPTNGVGRTSDKNTSSRPTEPKPGGPRVAQTSSAPGGTGTTYEPPAWSRLPAGEEATMALWIHPSATGVVDVPVLVCYEPPPPAPPLLKYRTVRLAAGTIATPSMVVSATVANAASHPAARVVRVSATNASGTSSSYEIRSVALVRDGGGPRVRLATMGLPASTPRIVAPGRRWDTLLLAEPEPAPPTENGRREVDGDDDDEDFLAKIRIGAEAKSEPSGSRPPVVRLHRASAPERVARGGADSRSRLNTNRRADVLDGVDVVVEWSEIPPVGCDGVGAAGAHHLRAVADPAAANGVSSRERTNGGRSAASSSSAAAAALRDVRWTLEGPPTATLPGKENASAVSGDAASASAGVVVPVTLRAHNPAPAPVRITFEAQTASAGNEEEGWTAAAGGAGWSDASANAGDADDGASRVPQSIAPGRPWLWVGPVKRSVVARGGETVDVPLRVAAFVPGTFALGEYRVTWEPAARTPDGKKSVAGSSRACNAPFLITVVEP